jgi:hypothetical protein
MRPLRKMVSSFSSDNEETDKRGVAIWRAMLYKQDVKPGLERRRWKLPRIKPKPV